jgi:hypothetical protein
MLAVPTAQQTPVVQSALLWHVTPVPPPSPLPLLLVVPEEDPAPEDDELVLTSLPESAGGLDDELLQPGAKTRAVEPALSAHTKRIFELCIGNVPPPE